MGRNAPTINKILISFVGTGCGDRVVHELILRELRKNQPTAEIIGLDDCMTIDLAQFRLPLDRVIGVEHQATAVDFSEDPAQKKMFLSQAEAYLHQLVCREQIDLLIYFLGDSWVREFIAHQQSVRAEIEDGWIALENWRRQGHYPSFQVQESDFTIGRQLLPPDKDHPIIGIHLRNCSYRPENNLARERYRSLVAGLSGCRLVILGKNGESPEMDDPNILDLTRLDHPLTVGQLAGILCQVDLFIGGESFLTHLAAACRRPIVACEYVLPHGPLIGDSLRRIFWFRNSDPIERIRTTALHLLKNRTFRDQ